MPDMLFKSPHIQEALPDLIEWVKQGREICNERRLAFVVIVHDGDAVDSYVASNLPQHMALELISLTGEQTGHGPPKKIG